jgi:uncharacterized membrane protein YbhN (UPF0104 family)
VRTVTDRRHRRPSRPSWGAVFGVVPDRGVHRRPSELVRIGIGAVVVAVGAVRARNYSRLEVLVHDVVTALPGPLLDGLKVLNGAGVVVALVVVGIAALAARRIRFLGSVVVAGALATGLAVALRAGVDAPDAVGTVPGLVGAYPDYPSLRLTLLAAVFFVAAPELTRPARRLQWAVLVFVAGSVLAVTDGYPSGIAGSLALGWAVGAVVHLAFGSPDGVPDPDAVRADAADLGVELATLAPSPVQVWGEQAFDAADADGPARVVVIGRDATDARFLTKLFRFVWYKDSGPTLALSRPQQIEHRAYVLLLAERAGVAAPRVVVSGAAGDKGDAMLVLRSPDGVALSDLDPASVDESTLDAAWAQLAALHELGVAHHGIEPAELVVGGTVGAAFVDLATAETSPDDAALLADRAALLVTLAVASSEERAVASGLRALGPDGLGAVLPLLQAPALPRGLRRVTPDVKHLTARLRAAIVAETGVEEPQLVELHRVSLTSVLMAAGAALGVYLLVGQLAEVDWSTVFEDALWAWIPVVALFSQLPQFGSAIAVLGSVSQPLPMRPVVGLQFANNFTGLVGGTVATTAMVVRFFQRQGMTAAVAVSSGLLTSVAAAVIQTIFVVAGLLLVGSSFQLDDTGSRAPGGIFIALVLGVALVSGAVALVPRLRRRIGALVVPQLRSARDNLKAVLTEPRKGLELFGGNLISQVFFALTLWAALECYGQSLGLVQLILINSFASVIGGIAPVPGGMGVIEAGLIGGFTAAGIPQEQAVAATFTARMFTAYLPPIWGYGALAWLRRREYL